MIGATSLVLVHRRELNPLQLVPRSPRDLRYLAVRFSSFSFFLTPWVHFVEAVDSDERLFPTILGHLID